MQPATVLSKQPEPVLSGVESSQPSRRWPACLVRRPEYHEQAAVGGTAVEMAGAPRRRTGAQSGVTGDLDARFDRRAPA